MVMMWMSTVCDFNGIIGVSNSFQCSVLVLLCRSRSPFFHFPTVFFSAPVFSLGPAACHFAFDFVRLDVAVTFMWVDDVLLECLCYIRIWKLNPCLFYFYIRTLQEPYNKWWMILCSRFEFRASGTSNLKCQEDRLSRVEESLFSFKPVSDVSSMSMS